MQPKLFVDSGEMTSVCTAFVQPDVVPEVDIDVDKLIAFTESVYLPMARLPEPDEEPGSFLPDFGDCDFDIQVNADGDD